VRHPVVDDLHDGPELVVLGQDERAGVLLEFPPLPVRMELGGKFRERWMRRTQKIGPVAKL
jgi:hypothetical protein